MRRSTHRRIKLGESIGRHAENRQRRQRPIAQRLPHDADFLPAARRHINPLRQHDHPAQTAHALTKKHVFEEAHGWKAAFREKVIATYEQTLVAVYDAAKPHAGTGASVNDPEPKAVTLHVH